MLCWKSTSRWLRSIEPVSSMTLQPIRSTTLNKKLKRRLNSTKRTSKSRQKRHSTTRLESRWSLAKVPVQSNFTVGGTWAAILSLTLMVGVDLRMVHSAQTVKLLLKITKMCSTEKTLTPWSKLRYLLNRCVFQPNYANNTRSVPLVTFEHSIP